MIDTIEGYSAYHISKEGFVKSDGFITVDKNGRKWIKPPSTLKGCTSKNGYVNVLLRSDSGKLKRFYVHTLVGMLYVPNPDNHKTINHIDGNPNNNHYSNLEWCNQKRNMMHAYYEMNKKGYVNRPIKQLSMQGEFIKLWPSVNMASKQLGLSSTAAIWQALTGRSSYAKGYKWKYQ